MPHDQAYESLLDAGIEDSQDSSGESQLLPDAGWQDVIKFCDTIPRMELDQIMLPGVPVPEVGTDLTLGAAIVATAELCWPNLKLPLMMEPPEALPGIQEWTLVSVHQADWIEQLLNRIRAAAISPMAAA